MADFYAELPIKIKITGTLSRHGRVRERRRAAAAHRDAERHRDHQRQGHAGRSMPTPRRSAISTKRRSRSSARPRRPRKRGEGRRNESASAATRRGCVRSLVAGCGGESHQDLRVWMAEQGKGARGKLDPLPQIKPYDPFAYNAFDLPDPFKPRKIEPTKGASKLAPDLTRRKEPLEAYPLESLAMVGTLETNKTVFALVRTPDRDVYQIRAGNYRRPELRRRDRHRRRRNQVEGADPGRRGRLDRAVEHAAIAAGRREDPTGTQKMSADTAMRITRIGDARRRGFAAALLALARLARWPAVASAQAAEQPRRASPSRARAPAASWCASSSRAPPANPPASFAITSPPRIALDFLDTTNGSGRDAAAGRRGRAAQPERHPGRQPHARGVQPQQAAVVRDRGRGQHGRSSR